MLSIQFYSTIVSKIMECGYFLERKRSFIVLPVLEMQKLSGSQKQIVVSSKLIHCRSRLSGKSSKRISSISWSYSNGSPHWKACSLFIVWSIFMLGMCIFFSGCSYIYLWIWCDKDADPHIAKSDELYPEHALYLCEKYNRLYSKM